GYVFGRMFCIAHRPLQSPCNELNGLFRQLIRSGTFLCQNAIESVLQGKLMVNLPPELGAPDVWAGGGIGLIAGLLLRYFIVRVFIVFRLFGREWSFDLKDRTRTDNHTDPR
ncbi:hypothetical protein P4G42_23140, partial [Shigella boydii]|nr:hypothetical protein [Shigella boydii]